MTMQNTRSFLYIYNVCASELNDYFIESFRLAFFKNQKILLSCILIPYFIPRFIPAKFSISETYLLLIE